MKASPASPLKNKASLIICCLLTACVAPSATPFLWESEVSDSTADQYQSRMALGNDHIYQCFSIGNGMGQLQSFMRKLTVNGEELWRTPLDLSNDCATLTLTNDGILATGSHASSPVTKIGENGEIEWTHVTDLDSSTYFYGNISQGSSGNVYISYEDLRNNRTIVESIAKNGSVNWIKNYAVGEFSGQVRPVLELPGGDLVMFVWVSGKQNVIVNLDSEGNELQRVPYGAGDGNVVYADQERIVFVERDKVSHMLTRAVSMDTHGVEQWSYPLSGFGSLDCANPNESMIACVQYTTLINHIHFFQLDGSSLRSVDKNYQTNYFHYPSGSPRIVNAGIDKWVVLESVVPESAPNLASSMIPKNYYSRFHVLNGLGDELNVITMKPGKVKFKYVAWNNDYSDAVVTAFGDMPSGFSVSGNQLLVSGWFGNYSYGRNYMRGYQLDPSSEPVH